MKRTGKRKALPKACCDVCGPQPGEAMSLCCPTLCHRHCPHPLPPADIPDWTPEGQAQYALRSSFTITVHGREWRKSESGRRKGA